VGAEDLNRATGVGFLVPKDVVDVVGHRVALEVGVLEGRAFCLPMEMT
jgi:hypothetical protein